MSSIIPFIAIICVIIAKCYGNNNVTSISNGKNFVNFKKTTTLKDFGDLTVKIVQSMVHDGDDKEIDLQGITQLVTALSRAAVLVDHPQEMYQLEKDSAIMQRLDKLEQENEKLHQALKNYTESSVVEFLAYLSYDQALSSSGTVVKFDNIVKQSGGQDTYNSVFGFFTCPQSGHYFISFQFLSSSSTISVKVIVGSNPIWKSYNTYETITVSGSEISHCNQGEKIRVEGYSGIIKGYSDENTMLYIYLIRRDVLNN